MKLLEKFMQKGSLWNYPVPRPKILYSPPFCMYGRGGYFPLIPLLLIEKLGYPSCSTQLINKNGGQHC